MFDNTAVRELGQAQAKIKELTLVAEALQRDLATIKSENEVLRRDLAVAKVELALQGENAILKGKLEATLFQVSLREALAEQRMFAKVEADSRDQELVQRTMGHLAPLLASTDNGGLRTLTQLKEEQ